MNWRFWQWSGKTKWLIGGPLVALVLIILFTPWLTDLLARPLTLHEQPQATDVIIVLGGGVRKKVPQLPVQPQLRLEMGVSLWQDQWAPWLIVSGGENKKTKLVEADFMAAYARQIGLPTEAVIEENRSRDTHENAINTLAIMSRQSWTTALVVTSNYHTWRACKIFRKLQADVRCLAAPIRRTDNQPLGDRLNDLRSVVREYGAIVYGWLRGYI